MAIILCATRGGEEGYRTQDKAIAMAKERGDTLLFLYVVDLQFLDKTAAPIVVDVEDEISDMGEFLLLMAKERAAEQGVEANTICRKGNLRQEIKITALEENVSLVLLGRPVSDKSAFQLASLEKLAQEIESETGVKAEIV
jgi:nucleotide-binding universal stress UspA family protein